MTIYIGIDISKRTFDAAIPHRGRKRVESFTNDEKGFVRLKETLPAEAVCVMEASGPYCFRLATYLHDRGVQVSIVNPLVIRRFAQMMLSRTKTDKADAIMIAAYAETMKPEQWLPATREESDLQQQRTAVEHLTKQQTQLKNSIKALEEMPYPSKGALEALRSVLKEVQDALRELENRMIEMVSVEYGPMYDRLCSIKGIGRKTALELLIITRGFTRFPSAKQLVAYLGQCPRIFESGTSVKGKPRIVKMGMARTRRLLYMCAQAAIRSNAACSALYERLTARGKAGKLALVAVANKLMRQAHAIATSGAIYDSEYESRTATA